MTFRNATIDSLLADQSAAYPERTFLRDRSRSYSYAEVDQLACSAAAALADLGLSAGDRLAILLPNVAEFVIGLFAAAKAGLLLVPIHLRRNRSEVLARLAKTAAKAVITFSDPASFKDVDHLAMLLELKPDLPELALVLSTQGEAPDAYPWAELISHQPLAEHVSNSPDSAAAIVHTLGSSGQPRGAILTHAGMVRNAADIAAALDCGPSDVILGAVPFSNAFGLTPTILATAAAGASLICMKKYEAGQAIQLIQACSVTVHHGIPTMFALELNHAQFTPDKVASLRTGLMAGAPCPPDLIAQVREKMIPNLLIAYGLTEASPSVTMTRLDDGPVTATRTVGRPMPGVQIKVIDPDGRDLSADQEGELCVRGYNVMQGYWDDPAATAKVLDDEGWLRTGDLAVIDLDGPVRILGRTEEVINKAYLRERLRVRGTAWTFGKNIDTDAIIPARRCITSDPAELAKYCMEDADPEFINKMQRGDVIVADTNFGCGSSREVAPISIKAAGVSAVVAKSFARIFFRNSINIGLPILESAQAVDGIEQGDELEIESSAGVIRNLTKGTEFSATPYPEFLQNIIEGGGLLPYVEARLAERDS